MFKILSVIKDIVWGFPTLALLTVFGAYFTYKTGFYRIKSIKKIFSDLVFSLKNTNKNGISPFAAVATALGGTVGIGSIVGVGYAVAVGGAGSIFWMWVCSFFGMGLKYAEVKIGLNKRMKTEKGNLGGAPFRLKGLGYKKTAILFSILCILVSFGTGNLTQIGAMSSFLISVGTPRLLCSFFCCALIALAVLGGRKRIASINSAIIPLASAVYLMCALCIIILNRANLCDALFSIFREALGISALTGGFSGAMLSHVIREGFARSLFSNEAGMGSSPLAHATAEGHTDIQAEWGIFEIFFDTFVVSGITAFALLSGDNTDVSALFGECFGEIGVWMFGILTAVFAFASVISWCYYAQCCVDFMFPDKNIPVIIYKLMFCIISFAGCYISLSVIWDVADILNALMMFPNLFLLYKCRKEIERI